mmetsp:Transcript_100953/g.301188  ORF Transcript_100953/g.301188 Transcript_100953/m.301188 type:complete len:244 (+) Transcript_100953:118-849(+)
MSPSQETMLHACTAGYAKRATSSDTATLTLRGFALLASCSSTTAPACRAGALPAPPRGKKSCPADFKGSMCLSGLREGLPSTEAPTACCPGRRWIRSTHARGAPPPEAPMSMCTRPAPSLARAMSVRSPPRRSKTVRVVERATEDGKASNVSTDQSWASTRVPGSLAVTSIPPSRRYHMGCCSYTRLTVMWQGPKVTLPSHASSQCPGGIQTERSVSFCCVSQIGATRRSFRKMYWSLALLSS